ncbi:hypothetical protein GOM49_09870 [Clostridium bovifaecis]|uniref:Uncharacterized protein n=1 Tax=Clostridium bovifaecis TaxID=2184719 RepID=A0A6I6F2B5_9CLOT|nr:hypothetical protein GOM49_09870 [Clostridium bovifaecis]
MNNHAVKISDRILKEFDSLVKEAGVSQQEFLSYVAKFYNINSNFEKDSIDYGAYYDSFIA